MQGCLRQLDFLRGEIAMIDRALAEQAVTSPEIQRLMTIPGVGITTAATVMATIVVRSHLRRAIGQGLCTGGQRAAAQQDCRHAAAPRRPRRVRSRWRLRALLLRTRGCDAVLDVGLSGELHCDVVALQDHNCANSNSGLTSAETNRKVAQSHCGGAPSPRRRVLQGLEGPELPCNAVDDALEPRLQSRSPKPTRATRQV